MADTIYALATSPGRGAVAMVRVSGPAAGSALQALARDRPKPRVATRVTLKQPADGAELDRALVLWFPGPDSYTGEDVAEFHVHGGRAVVEGLEQCLAGLGLRPAEPGEFTRRAFEHGKLDLSQAEAVADLVEAQTDAQRRQALGQLEGALTRRHETWREAILDGLALLEANVDFPDEELPADLAARAAPGLTALADSLAAALADAARGERVREGYRIALVGAPNAGKSSLLNALAGRDAAIVTASPGTTRDVIEVPMTLAGFHVLIADTAGVRPTEHEIEAEGVRRARAWAQGASLRVWVVDGSASDGAWREAWGLVELGDPCVLTKADLGAGSDAAAVREAWPEPLPISVRSGEGMDELREAVSRRVTADLGGADFPATTRERHRRHLEEAFAHVKRAIAALGGGSELAAEDLRLAGRALQRISGQIDPEAVLDKVFSQFCIGK
jgi:tRNA modification GTPase